MKGTPKRKEYIAKTSRREKSADNAIKFSSSAAKAFNYKPRSALQAIAWPAAKTISAVSKANAYAEAKRANSRARKRNK